MNSTSVYCDADLQFRLRELRSRLDSSQARLQAQNELLARLQDDAAALKSSYRGLHERAAETLQALTEAAREPAYAPLVSRPAPDLPPVAEPAVSRAEASSYDAARASRLSPGLWLPSAALALAAFAMSLWLPGLYVRRAAPDLAPAAPAIEKTVLPIDFSDGAVPSPDGGQVGREDADAAVRLVYDYVPAGSKLSVRELLQKELAQAAQSGQDSPWILEKAGEGRLFVTLRPGGDAEQAPLYEFEVDPARGSVEPSQETLADLESEPRLASR